MTIKLETMRVRIFSFCYSTDCYRRAFSMIGLWNMATEAASETLKQQFLLLQEQQQQKLLRRKQRKEEKAKEKSSLTSRTSSSIAFGVEDNLELKVSKSWIIHFQIAVRTKESCLWRGYNTVTDGHTQDKCWSNLISKYHIRKLVSSIFIK